jgi:hypothetical protein
MFDRDKIRFHSKVMAIAREVGGSVNGEDARPFVDALYEAYQKDGTPKAVEVWLRHKLAQAFKSVGQPPRWIESESGWAFNNGAPMVFIHQVDLVRNEVTETSLGYDQTVYFFGARQPVPDGFELVYKTVTQVRGF